MSAGTGQEELAGLGFEPARGGGEAPGCETWWATEPRAGTEGLGEVYTREGSVVGVGIYAGPTAEGVAVGDDTDALLRAFPELAVTGVDGALLPPFPATLADGRRLTVTSTDEQTMPRLVDAPLPTGRQTVAGITVFWSPCQA